LERDLRNLEADAADMTPSTLFDSYYSQFDNSLGGWPVNDKASPVDGKTFAEASTNERLKFSQPNIILASTDLIALLIATACTLVMYLAFGWFWAMLPLLLVAQALWRHATKEHAGANRSVEWSTSISVLLSAMLLPSAAWPVAERVKLPWPGANPQGANPQGEGANPQSVRWSIGQIVELEIVLVKGDALDLACASSKDIGGKHCGFVSQNTPWRGGPVDDRKIYKPYMTTNGVRLAAAGLWSEPALRVDKLPAMRFAVKCKYQVEGMLKKIEVRWHQTEPWYPSGDLYAGSVSDCKLSK
jgi:hypothetical protein